MYRFRLDRANEVMRDENLDGMLLTSFDNLRYVADCRIYFTTITLQNSYLALVLPGKSPLIQGPAIEAKLSNSIMSVDGWNGYPLVPANAMSSKWCSLVASMLRANGVRSGRMGIDDLSFMSYLGLKGLMPKIYGLKEVQSYVAEYREFLAEPLSLRKWKTDPRVYTKATKNFSSTISNDLQDLILSQQRTIESLTNRHNKIT